MFASNVPSGERYLSQPANNMQSYASGPDDDILDWSPDLYLDLEKKFKTQPSWLKNNFGRI